MGHLTIGTVPTALGSIMRSGNTTAGHSLQNKTAPFELAALLIFVCEVEPDVFVLPFVEEE